MTYNTKDLQSVEWKKKRQEVLARDHYTCQCCGKKMSDGAILQVHHLGYMPGKKLWEYPNEMLTTVCKYCHAAEHGKLPPKGGWKYIGYYELDDISGCCELCGNSLKYEYYVYHPDWGFLTVGCDCVEKIMATSEETDKMRKEFENGKKKAYFIKSSKWKNDSQYFYYRFFESPSIKNRKYEIKIEHVEKEQYVLIIASYPYNKWTKKQTFNTLDAAKIAAYDYIISGECDKSFFISFGWKNRKNGFFKELASPHNNIFKIRIWENGDSRYRLQIGEYKGREYKSLEDAQSKAFDVIMSGQMDTYIANHRQ